MSFRAIERQANHLPREVVGFGVLRGTSHGRRTWSCHFRLGPRLAAALGWRENDFVLLLWGEDADAGRVRVQRVPQDTDGAVKLRRKDSVALYFRTERVPGAMPRDRRPMVACPEYSQVGDDAIEIVLPSWADTRASADSESKPDARPQSKSTNEASPPKSTNEASPPKSTNEASPPSSAAQGVATGSPPSPYPHQPEPAGRERTGTIAPPAAPHERLTEALLAEIAAIAEAGRRMPRNIEIAAQLGVTEDQIESAVRTLRTRGDVLSRNVGGFGRGSYRVMTVCATGKSTREDPVEPVRTVPLAGTAARAIHDYLVMLTEAGARMPSGPEIGRAVGVAGRNIASYLTMLKDRNLIEVATVNGQRVVKIVATGKSTATPPVLSGTEPQPGLATTDGLPTPGSGRRRVFDAVTKLALDGAPMPPFDDLFPDDPGLDVASHMQDLKNRRVLDWVNVGKRCAPRRTVTLLAGPAKGMSTAEPPLAPEKPKPAKAAPVVVAPPKRVAPRPIAMPPPGPVIRLPELTDGPVTRYPEPGAISALIKDLGWVFVSDVATAKAALQQAGCKVSTNGAGRFWVDGKQVAANRLADHAAILQRKCAAEILMGKRPLPQTQFQNAAE